ncbi:MAG: hypothetical protein LBR16_08380 [Treponema sp.]|jgi:hypothetical protein|nr:hypothetical protein [Treponema sp.]
MKIEMFTFCDFAQENGGKLTIVGTYDSVMAKKFPCFHQSLTVVIRVRFDLWEFGQHTFIIETKDMDGNPCFEPLSGTLNVESMGNDTAVTHLVFSLYNLRFKSEGAINFGLYIDEKEVGSIPLYVRHIQQPH